MLPAAARSRQEVPVEDHYPMRDRDWMALVRGRACTCGTRRCQILAYQERQRAERAEVTVELPDAVAPARPTLPSRFAPRWINAAKAGRYEGRRL